MTIVYKISENLRNEIIEHYRSTCRENKPPYSVFQSADAGTVVTLYESGKIMFQGVSADIDYAWWRDREKFVNKRDLDRELALKNAKDKKKNEELHDTRFKYVNTVGSDEVGTGDYFGPIIVTASYVSKSDIPFLEELGVRDSKKLTDDKILKIAPSIIEKIPHVSHVLRPKEYNNFGTSNMNKIKAILHNRVLFELLENNRCDYSYIVVDQFSLVSKYFEHINNEKNQIRNITFSTHAEDKCLSVAVSSIISRYKFLKEMDEMSQKYGMTFPKGASNTVDEFGVEFVKKFGFDGLYDTAKMNFKNTEKIENML